MNTYDIIRNYPTPKPEIHDRYRYETVSKGTGWPQLTVKVFRIEDAGDVQVAEYDRNYSMMKTFEPFAQKQEGGWHDYALISTDYMSLAVLDLESGEIIAKEQPKIATKEIEERTKGFIKEGDPMEGFCPTEFYVPSWWEEYDESDLPEATMKANPEGSKLAEFAIEMFEEMKNFEGQWGVYSGCMWGDDHSMKLRYVDLSRITEGIVTTDDRFGYLELPNKGNLQDHIDIHPESPRIKISTFIYYDMEKKQAVGKDWGINSINWEDDPKKK